LVVRRAVPRWSGVRVLVVGRTATRLLNSAKRGAYLRIKPSLPAAAAGMCSPTPDARPSLRRTATWVAVAVLSGLVAAYALSFLVRGAAAFPPVLRESFLARPWGIYPHAALGAIALLVGPLQFRRSLWIRRRALHRRLGIVYVVCAALTGTVGVYMAAFSFGGWITHVGFGLLGFFTLATTLAAFVRIRQRRVAEHREAMILSFACIFAAVTLRLELPLLIVAFQGDFPPAYAVVSWLSWVPNLAWAWWYVTRRRGREDLPSLSSARA
jgi:uncharacterized membrane protein